MAQGERGDDPRGKVGGTRGELSLRTRNAQKGATGLAEYPEGGETTAPNGLRRTGSINSISSFRGWEKSGSNHAVDRMVPQGRRSSNVSGRPRGLCK